MRDQAAVPDSVEVAGVVAAGVRAEHRYRNVVATVPDAKGVERLMEIADEVHQELQGDRAIRAIERRVREPFLVVQDPVHRAVAPPVAACIGADSGLARAVAIAIVAGRLRRDVEEVPVERLVIPDEILIRPRRHVRQRFRSQQPGHVPARERRQTLGREQRNETVPLSAPRLHALGRHEREEPQECTPAAERPRHFAGARFSVSSM